MSSPVPPAALAGMRLRAKDDDRSGTASFLQSGLPVDDHVDRDTAGGLGLRDANKEAAVFADVELVSLSDGEQGLWRACLELIAVGFHLDRHHLVVVGEKVKLTPVVAPDRPVAASGRDLPLAAVFGEGLHIHLGL